MNPRTWQWLWAASVIIALIVGYWITGWHAAAPPAMP